ncbi:hypothetical protein N9100_00045 [Gammaproteobacteria bacterium]|nr:hypothetical protein [Gammaproteobacteria bacterium]
MDAITGAMLYRAPSRNVINVIIGNMRRIFLIEIMIHSLPGEMMLD